MGIKRRWIGRLLACCLLLIVGCRSEPIAEGPIRLILWHGVSPPSNRQIFQERVDAFNQSHPDIYIDARFIGQPDQQIPKILTAVVGQATPDILWYVPQLTGRLVELEAIQPLETWLNTSPIKADIDPALFETMELEGHIWSVPFATNNAAVFYRPSLFKAAGITELPHTWEAFRQTAQRLTRDTDGDGRIDQYGVFLSLGKGAWTVFAWLPFVYSAGGWLTQGKTPDLMNSGAIAALELAQKLVQDGSALLSAPERGYETDNFIQGKVAMQISGPWNLPRFEASGVDYAVFPFPVAQKPAAVLGGENFFLCHTTPERTQAAWTFLEYVLSPEFQIPWAIGTGYLPISQNVRQSSEYQQFIAKNPNIVTFLDQMAWAKARPIIPGYTYVSESFGRAIEATLLGEPPERALRQSQKHLELVLGAS